VWPLARLTRRYAAPRRALVKLRRKRSLSPYFVSFVAFVPETVISECRSRRGQV
jgi:hypothetical protein